MKRHSLRKWESIQTTVKGIEGIHQKKYDFRIVWKTKKIEQLFPLKEKNPYPSCNVYEGVCFSKENYIGKTKQNVGITHWNEH